MGLFDSLKQEAARNFIARPPEAGDAIVYQWPDKNIRMMTQLTVHQDEVALFVKNGTVVGTLGPGTHSLSTNNVPFISKLLEGVTGGNLFMAELFFVLTREIPSIKFGGPVGTLQDPKLKLAVTPLVHGEFSLRVADPQKLVVGLAGLRMSTDAQFLNWFKEQVKKCTREQLASMVVRRGMTLFDMTSGAYNSDIEAAILGQVQGQMVSYGVEVMRFGNVEASLNDNDMEKLQNLTEMQAHADLGTNPGLQGFAQAKMMMGAGEGFAKGGEGGGAALQGMGLGMGMSMANMFQQNQQQRPFGNQQQQAPQAAAPAPAAAGPTLKERLEQLKEAHAAGLLTDEEFAAKKQEFLKSL